MSARSQHQKLLALQAEMEAAAQAMDFEKAAALRNQIARLKGETPKEAGDDTITVTVGQPPPGAMGLGTQVPVRQPPKGWTRPRKPDPMTTSVKGRRGS